MKDEALNGITRGMKLKCKITGIKGICTAISEHINGSMQVCIIISLKEPNESSVKRYWSDYHAFVIEDIHIADEMEPMDKDLGFETGMDVYDRITGIEGTITEMIVSTNGCINIAIEGPKIKKDGIPTAFWMDQHRAVKIGTKKQPMTKSTTRGGAASDGEMPPMGHHYK